MHILTGSFCDTFPPSEMTAGHRRRGEGAARSAYRRNGKLEHTYASMDGKADLYPHRPQEGRRRGGADARRAAAPKRAMDGRTAWAGGNRKRRQGGRRHHFGRSVGQWIHSTMPDKVFAVVSPSRPRPRGLRKPPNLRLATPPARVAGDGRGF